MNGMRHRFGCEREPLCSPTSLADLQLSLLPLLQGRMAFTGSQSGTQRGDPPTPEFSNSPGFAYQITKTYEELALCTS